MVVFLRTCSFIPALFVYYTGLSLLEIKFAETFPFSNVSNIAAILKSTLLVLICINCLPHAVDNSIVHVHCKVGTLLLHLVYVCICVHYAVFVTLYRCYVYSLRFMLMQIFRRKDRNAICGAAHCWRRKPKTTGCEEYVLWSTSRREDMYEKETNGKDYQPWLSSPLAKHWHRKASHHQHLS